MWSEYGIKQNKVLIVVIMIKIQTDSSIADDKII